MPITHELQIEIADECRKQKEYCILCHERLGQPVPPKTIVHIIENPLFASPLIVKLHNLQFRVFPVVGEDATIGIFRLSCKSPWIGANQLPKDFGYPEHEERDILYTSYLRSEALHLRVQ